MSVAEFLELFIKELEINSNLREYYRLLNNKSRFLWRKAYLEQRLRYVHAHLPPAPGNIWDVGCGYATTAIFLALNGYQVQGNTLEFYFDTIQSRLDYWSKFGDLSRLKIMYANLFDMEIRSREFDVIIAQDTLHHLEPIDQSFKIFGKSLKPGGRLVVTEENGQSLFIRLKNFSKRGFKKTNEFYDEHLKKNILFGNENARSMQEWERLLNEHGFELPSEEIEYIRIYPPFSYNDSNYQHLMRKDKIQGKNIPLFHELLYFGINFTANNQ
jgi:SAM-dependent methyltransferase